MYKILTAAGAAAILAAGAAQAGTAPASIAVSATVLSTCSATTTALAFPNYTPGAGLQTGTSTINVKCTKNSPFTVALNAGTTTGATFTQRLMALGANTLQYNLYTTVAHTTVLGDGTTGTSTDAGTGAGLATAVAFTVFGQLPDSVANQAAPPGAYTDTIAVTVSY